MAVIINKDRLTKSNVKVGLGLGLVAATVLCEPLSSFCVRPHLMLLPLLLAMLTTFQALSLRFRCCPNSGRTFFMASSSAVGSGGRDKEHQEFLSNRNWPDTIAYISSIIGGAELPAAIEGDGEYGATDLAVLNAVGSRSEFKSRDYRYSKEFNYAMRIGYCGIHYNGYQRQRGTGAHTVEDDIKKALGVVGYASGRTDAGVSAICQIVNFKTKNLSPSYNETIMQQMLASDACKEGRIRIYGCQRVPRRFNARSSATWRRYVYLFPLNRAAAAAAVPPSDCDVDAEAVNALLSRIEGRELPFNALAYAEQRDKGFGLQDRCTLFRARATVIEASVAPGGNPALCVELGSGLHNRPLTSPSLYSYTVGSRFLRRMVRHIVSTAIRESRRPASSRNPDALLDICLSGDRSRCAEAAPGETLLLAGVGYDARDLLVYKFMSKAAREEAERVGAPSVAPAVIPIEMC